ncbi:nucleotidyl transferase AbiEii/AbiGii toxin family protein [Arenibacter sp. GZD96]|uniref:nucleotidyl transferase AbiEii/AbiGii toxin family protein n=1 Tax=Aurantibrevibacter litoralis TaxID=3106030 RepID=UPI002AFF71F5|nr:nucleotidyl transferase AbiEii/AbiGii toxin family protein [Arenibacter sp. GZD-96]MEA1787738.1 nucleotidyl transferase AbiEii/AbiGii toxin family protein [Arenibacter sp. GZD-96]
MIPQAYITEWSQQVPWQTNEQVEQDLVICRALVEIFSDDWLADSLSFRGGTALHKLYLQPQPRYSEDIDLVQVRAEPIKETVQRLQTALSFLGDSAVKPRRDGTQIICRFDSEFPPSIRLRLKVETNTREHFTVHGLQPFPFEVKSSWFNGKCELTTYRLEELLGTKLRALYQRRKGRDLYDMFIALSQQPDLDKEALLHSYREYMKFSVEHPPTQKQYLLNMEAKMQDAEFLGDTTALLRPDVPYNPQEAYELVRTELIEKI